MTFKSIVNYVLPYCEIQHFPANHIITNELEDKFCFLLKGAAHSLIRNNGGSLRQRDLILFDLGVGDFFGALTFPGETKKQTFDTYVKSTRECEVGKISMANIEYIMKVSPEFMFYFSQQIANRMQTCKTRLLGRLYSQEYRIKELLYKFSKKSDAITHPDGMQIKSSRKEIGARLDIPSLKVGAILCDLQRQKIITFKKRSSNIVVLREEVKSSLCAPRSQ